MGKKNIEQRLNELGIDLPSPAKPLGAYAPAVQVDHWVFTSGQLPIRDGKLVAAGKVPGEVPLEAAQAAARQAAVNALAAIRSVLGSLEGISRVVRLSVFVNSSAGFTDQAKVANGASELIGAVFGASGTHARSAVGVAELPLNATVELDLTVTIEDVPD